MSEIKLPYLGRNASGNQIQTPNGFYEVSGVYELYKDVDIRNVYVARVDMMQCLTEFFSNETLKNYRHALYYIISGTNDKTDKDKIASALNQLYEIDNTFKLKMGSIVYFRKEETKSLSVFDTLILEMKSALSEYEHRLMNELAFVKYICTDKLYLYISKNEDVPVNKNTVEVNMEAVSNVKVWNI